MSDLSSRTKDFSLRIIHLFGVLPKTVEAQVIGKQWLIYPLSFTLYPLEISLDLRHRWFESN